MWRVFSIPKAIMKYTKKALSFEEQADLLVGRGLIVSDRDELVQFLGRVNYYRLSAYFYMFKSLNQKGEECFKPNTNFNRVKRFYLFDRELRLLLMDPIEQIEVAILRTRMVNYFSRLYGPFGYLEIENFSNALSIAKYKELLAGIGNAVNKSKEEFVGRYKAKYTEEHNLPFWMLVELMSHGELCTIFSFLKDTMKKEIARDYRIPAPILNSWLHTLNFTRNACAHHSRLWNRILPISPLVPNPRSVPEWHYPVSFRNDHIFAVLTIIKYLIGFINPANDFQQRLIILLGIYPDIPLSYMGFPHNWLDCPIWGK
jgi:abortive infection bacteriophage resistance protein